MRVVQVGRTKIITLHSGIWAVNSTDRVLRLRLHIPTSPLAAPRAAAAACRPGQQEADAQLGPLAPGKGQWSRLQSHHVIDSDRADSTDLKTGSVTMRFNTHRGSQVHSLLPHSMLPVAECIRDILRTEISEVLAQN